MSRTTLIVTLIAFGGVLAVSPPTPAQKLPRPGLYELTPKSVYQFGCFGPLCLCPISMVQELAGTFVLEERGEEEGIFVFEVRQARFVAPTNPPTLLEGSGVYRVHLVDGGTSHEMQLSLFVNDESVQLFDSSIVERDPDTRGITISPSWHDGVCEGAQVDLVAEWISAVEGPRFLRGDCNDDGNVDLSDAVCTLNWLFLGGPAPGCLAATNTNGDEEVDLSDPVSLLNHLFLGGPAPVLPFPECGPGTLPTDAETCESPPNNCPQ